MLLKELVDATIAVVGRPPLVVHLLLCAVLSGCAPPPVGNLLASDRVLRIPPHGPLEGDLDDALTAVREEVAKTDYTLRHGFRRKQRLGGSADDPAVRVAAQLGDIGERLEGIRANVQQATAQAASPTPRDATLNRLLQKLDGAMDRLQRPKIDIQVEANLPPGFSDLLDQQTAVVERVLLPLVHTVTRSLEEGDSIRVQLMALIDDLKRMDQRLKQLSPEELRALGPLPRSD